MKQKASKKAPLVKSFKYAFEGIFAGVIKERNMKIHCAAAAAVTAAGFIFHISAAEWCICLVLFGLIFSLELVNTSCRSGCGFSDRGTAAACKAGEGYGGRCGTHCSDNGGRCRLYYFHTKGNDIF